MKAFEIRQSFLDFFREKQHTIVRSASLLPSAPNLLFTNAGMNQFVPYFLGQEKPPFKPPRVAEAPCALECKYVQTVPLQDHHGNPIEGFIVIGLVVGVHIDERYIRNGLLDSAAMKPIARGGYHDYSVLDKSFTMRRPASVAETKTLADTKAG